MIADSWRCVLRPMLLAAFVALPAVDCGGRMPGGGLPRGMPGAGKCPDMTDADAVARFDWAKEFRLDASAGGKLKGGVSAALNLHAMAAQIDEDLRVACGDLVRDLGKSRSFKTGQEACKEAIRVMGETRAKLGANARYRLVVQPPRCSASMNAMAECSGQCAGSVDAGKAEVTCEGGELSGSCDAKCEGKCELSSGAACSGRCEGACDASFRGHCDGTCTGKCDGRDSKGTCHGTCSGKCSAGAEGECKGTCSGTCRLKAAAECHGTCTGKCSVKMKEPMCSGSMHPPKVSASCRASCEAKVSGKMDCVPAKVDLVVEGARDASLAAKYRAAVEKNLPGVLKIAIGMRERVEGVSSSVTGVVGGVQAAAKATKGGPVVAATLAACIASPIKGAADAAASLRASVNVSVEVKASASASGHASGRAG